MSFLTEAEQAVVDVVKKVAAERARLAQDPDVERAEQEAHAAARDFLQPLINALELEAPTPAPDESAASAQQLPPAVP